MVGCHDGAMGPTYTFRTLYARILTMAAAAVILIVLIYSLIDGGPGAAWQAVPFLVVGGGLIWVLFGNPKVEVADGGVTVVNLLRQVHVPWPTLRGVETRWALTLETTAGTYSSWAIPAASGTSMRLRRGRRGGRDRDPDATSALESGHNSDAVALVIGQRLESLTDAGYLDASPTHGQVAPAVRWNTREAVVLGLAVVVLAAMVLTG